MESSSGVARKTHNLQRRNGSRNESSRYTKRPLNEGRWKVARHEAKREIRMVGRPAGTERLPNVIEIYLAVISLFLPLGRPPRPDVSRSPYIKERGRRIDRNGRCLVMQTRICPSIRYFDLEFVPRTSVLRTSGLRGEREEGSGTEGDRPSGLIRASVHVPSVDRCFNRRKKRIKKRRYVNHWRRERGKWWLLCVIVILASIVGKGMMGLTGISSIYRRLICSGFIQTLYLVFQATLFIVIELFTWIILSLN